MQNDEVLTAKMVPEKRVIPQVNLSSPAEAQSYKGDAQQWLAAIVQSSDDAIIGQSLEGIVTSWNKSAERIFGYDASEILGKPISLLAWPGNVEDMPRLVEAIRRGERVDHYQTVRRHKNGGQIFVSLTLSGILDSEGKVIGISKISRDISTRKAADETLSRQAHLLDQVYEPIMVRTLDDRVVYWNKGAERAFGWTSDEAIGKLSRELLKREFVEPESLISEVLDTKGNWEGELVNVRRDGHRRTMLSRWKKQKGIAGWEILETSFDITERKASVGKGRTDQGTASCRR